MKTFNASGLLILALVVAGTVQSADEAVVSPTKRQEILGLAKGLLTPASPVSAKKDPFHSEAYAETLANAAGGSTTPTPSTTTPETAPVKPVPVGPRNPRELLQAIATSPTLKPSGSFVIGGQPTLIFGQKRVKAGSILNITFEGTEYALEIVSVAPPNFTLRLNREEFTRPIK